MQIGYKGVSKTFLEKVVDKNRLYSYHEQD